VVDCEKMEYGHMLNVFDVVGVGSVYVDCSGTRDCKGVDKLVFIGMSKYWVVCEYNKSLSLQEIYDSCHYTNETLLNEILPKGVVTNVEIYW